MPARPRAGRKPKPARLRVVEGNPGKRPIREGFRVPPVCPDRPAWTRLIPNRKGVKTDKDAQAVRRDAQWCWDAVIVELHTLGLLGRVDALMVTDLCVAWARIQQCERTISRDGITVEVERGYVKNPALTAANMYRQQLRFYMSELGLSPSSRTRLNMPGGQGGSDPAEEEVFGS